MRVRRRGPCLAAVVALLGLLAVLAVPSPVAAGSHVLVVTTTADVVDGEDGQLSLREAVIEANATPGAQLIHLPDDEYPLTRCGGPTDEDASLWGDLDLTDVDGVAITGKFPALGEPIDELTTVLDGGVGTPDIVQTCPAEQHQRILHNVPGAGELVVEAVELRGGHGLAGGAVRSVGPLSVFDASVSDNASDDTYLNPDLAMDGAITVENGPLLVERTVVADNDAAGVVVQSEDPAIFREVTIERNGGKDSGGIAVRGGGGSIEDSTIRDNWGTIGGGVASYFGTAVIERTLIEGNQATVGGGVHGPANISDSILRDNTAIHGGGALVFGSVIRSLIEDNAGGGLVIDGTVDSSTIAGNTKIGGVHLADGSTVTNSTITGNEGFFIGGVALFANFDDPAPSASVRWSTIAGNSATSEVPIADELTSRVFADPRWGTLVLEGNAIGEPGPGTAPSCAQGTGLLLSEGHNAADDATCALNPALGDRGELHDLELEPLSDNGGSAPTRLPSPSSPLVDRVPAEDPACTGVDQRAAPRPQGPACDVGSIERDLVASGFVPMSPKRILDTRFGPVPPSMIVGGKLIAASTRFLPIAGTAGVPLDATAVVVNVTSTQASSSNAYLTMWPGGFPTPFASTLNLQAGATVASSATLRLGGGGVNLRTNIGSTHLVVDVLGYYMAEGGDGFESTQPQRALDTRYGPVPPARSVGQPLTGPGALRLPLAGELGVPADATAVAVNITATQSTTNLGYLTVWPADDPRPVASNLNLQPGFNVANLAVVELGADGAIDIFTNSGSTHVVVDVVGYYGPTSAGRLVALQPKRLMDTRSGPPVAPDSERPLDIGGLAPVPDGASAVVLNATSTQASSSHGYLTLYPEGLVPRPLASTLNYRVGANVPNQVMTGLSEEGSVALYNGFGTVHYVVDLNGYFVELS